MKIDILSVFPEFFSVLDLSLVGKARESGILDVAVHDLREWAEDAHRSVDDTPAGGGAGMVMRADVWGRGLDAVIGGGEESAILAIPTPSGVPLTQSHCEELAARASHIVIACGRYEGIDARVADHYAARGVEIFEYSLGDYVLNGGEVAAIALIEAVGRLLPGVIGNPESLVEESHGGDGLLEYPVYTRPVHWRSLEIPGLLLSGNHGQVARWRRDRSLERTAERRGDIIAKLDAKSLDKKDRRTLARLGYLAPKGAAHPTKMALREARPSDAAALSAFASCAFPDACPPELSEESITAFICENLSEECFARYLADEHWLALVCESENGEFAGYTLSLIPEGAGIAGAEEGAPHAATIDGVVREGPLVELSKFYIDARYRGTGLSTALWNATRDALERRTNQWPEPFVWLGTHEGNHRARKAYEKMGFSLVGTRTFLVGDEPNSDVIFARRIRVA